MKKNGTYFKIGLFVIGVCAVLIAGVLFISADTLGGESFLVETYINESVQGLNVGSDVLYRGVDIGQVKTITLVPVEYPMDIDSPEFATYSRYVVVIMAIDPSKFFGLDRDPTVIESIIRNQIKEGLRFKLSYQGITGIAFIEADYVNPEQERPMSVPWIPKRIYVPSMPSLITSFTQALDKIFRRLNDIKIEDTLAKMETTLTTMDQAIKDAKIGEVRESFVALTSEVRESNQQLGQLLKNAETIPEDFNAVVTQLNKTLQQVEILLGRHEPDIDVVLADLKTLLQNLRNLSERLKQDPAQLLLSSPPKQSEVVE